jgi:uncharacterized protein YbjT (DUF2867 family)
MSILLLTGATGFLGSWILDMLANAESAKELAYDMVRLLVRDPARVQKKRKSRVKVEVVEGNLID